MSVAISVGVLAGSPDADPDGVARDREGLRQVNRVLAANGLPAHDEPECLPDFPYRGQLLSFPYSWLHYLRRAVAFARRAPDQFSPLGEGENPARDRLVDRELYTFMSSHLICHSDSEGFYVPVDFPEPLVDEQDGNLPGGILGSSQQALRELVRVAPLLGITLEGPTLSDEAARGIAQEPDGAHPAHPYWIERKVWLSLFEAFRHSIEYKCAVVFG